MTSEKTKIAVFLSGRGSNFQAIVKSIGEHRLPIEIAVVVSDKKDAKGLEFANSEGLKTVFVPRNAKSESASEFNLHLASAIEPYSPDYIVLAGYMRVIGPELISRYKHRIINIHPSLLPSFRGLHVHESAIEAGVRYSGCTVHFVVEEVDAGPIIGQAIVPVLPSDTPDSLAERILKQEHRLYPAVLAGLARGKIRLVEHNRTKKVEISPELLETDRTFHGISLKPL